VPHCKALTNDVITAAAAIDYFLLYEKLKTRFMLKNKVITSFNLTTLLMCCITNVWRGSIVIRALDLQPKGSRFKSRPLLFTYNPGQVVHTHMCLCSPSSINWYRLPAQAGS